MRRVVLSRFGDPADVLEVGDGPVPEPQRDQVRVRMLAAPINPSDLMLIGGKYGLRPELPATPGLEGVGIVEASGGGLLGRLMLGRRVAVPGSLTGTWAEYAIAPARRVIPVPAALSDEQAAMFFVNPATAWILTRIVLNVPRGATLVQTAAASSVGMMVIRLGRRFGFRTINVVRRQELATRLSEAGVASDDIVVSDGPGLGSLIRDRLGQGAAYAIDPVGGVVASELAGCLAPGGRLVVYGTLSGDPLSFDPRSLMTGGATVEGFWLADWIQHQTLWSRLRLVRQLGRLIVDGTLQTEVGETYSLDDVNTAVRAAAMAGRTGKILLRITSPRSGSLD